MLGIEWHASWSLITRLTVSETCLFRSGTLENPLVQTAIRIRERAVNDLITDPELVVAHVMSRHMHSDWNNAASSPRLLRPIIVVQKLAIAITTRTSSVEAMRTASVAVDGISGSWPRQHAMGTCFPDLEAEEDQQVGQFSSMVGSSKD